MNKNRYWDFKDAIVGEYSEDDIIAKARRIDFNDSIFCTVNELRILEKILSTSDKIKLKSSEIFLYLNSPTELTYDEFVKFYKNYKLYHIFVKGFSKKNIDDYNKEKTSDIDPEIMRIYLNKIKELCQGLPKYEINNKEKNIETICILSNRIVTNVLFDINTAINPRLKNYQSRYSVPNEIQGLLEKNCVCRGFAGIFRDCCNNLGFEVTNIFGTNNTEGHEWNQVKICDEWYNYDLTWDRYAILNKISPVFLLTNDSDFYRRDYLNADGTQAKSHMDYFKDGNFHDRHIADTSVSRDIITSHLYVEEEKKKRWLDSLLTKFKNREVGEER